MLWNTEPTIYSPTFHAQIGYPEMTSKVQERTSIEDRLTVVTKRIT